MTMQNLKDMKSGYVLVGTGRNRNWQTLLHV